MTILETVDSLTRSYRDSRIVAIERVFSGDFMLRAISIFDRGPRCPDGRPLARLELVNNLSSARVVLVEHPGAILHFRRPIDADASPVDTHCRLADALASRGHAHEFVAVLRTTLRLNPGDVETPGHFQPVDKEPRFLAFAPER